MNEKVKILQDLLKDRINAGHIEIWTNVDVYTIETLPEKLIKEDIITKDEFTIRWNGYKKKKAGKFYHDWRHKSYPLSDIDYIISKNEKRLKNGTKTIR